MHINLLTFYTDGSYPRHGPLTPFCLIIHPFIFWVPFSFCLFVLHLHSLRTFFSFSASPSSFYTLFSPPKSSLHLNPHSSSLLLSFLQPTPQSYTTSQFNHCTSESYEFLCSHLFVLLENPRLAFILFVVLALPLCKTGCYFFAPFVCLARRWLQGVFI